MTAAERFLSIYNQIDKYLRKLINETKSLDSYASVVKQLSNKNPVIRRYKDDLIQFGILRNAIVHEYKDGKIIAEPHNDTIYIIDHIWKAISDPIRIEQSKFMHEVFSVQLDDSVSIALKEMFNKQYSQVPVLENSKIVHVLSNNTISYWLASNLENELVDIVETKVKEVLEFTEQGNKYIIVSRKTSLAQVLDYFQEYINRGEYLNTILMTQNGHANERLLGIVTIEDLAEISILLAK